MLASLARRWEWLVLLVLAACAAALVLTVVPPFRRCPKLTRENFAKITVGMTLKEVDAILGVPPGRYNTDDSPIDLSLGMTPMGEYTICPALYPPDDQLDWVTWFTDDTAFRLTFGSDGRVFMVEEPMRVNRVRESSLDRLGRRLLRVMQTICGKND